MPTKSASKTITRAHDWLGPAIPPGEILLEEYLKPMGLGQVEAAGRLGISLNRLNEIILGKRGIAADTALRLSRLLKTSPQLWMRLQADWDLHRHSSGKHARRRDPPRSAKVWTARLGVDVARRSPPQASVRGCLKTHAARDVPRRR
jgi:addiction module HigA family antidote